MNDTQNHSKDRNQVMFWGNLIQAVTLIVLAVIIAYLLFSHSPSPFATNTAVAYAVLILATGVAFLNVMSISYTLRNLPYQAYPLTYASTVLLLFGMVSTIQGRAPFTTFFFLLLTTSGIIWLCPPNSKRSYSIFSATTFVLAWLIEWSNPFWRIVYTGPSFGLIAAIIFGVLFVLLVIYQSRNVITSSLQLTITFWAGAIIVSLSLGLLTYSVIRTRQEAISAAQQQALAISESNARLVHDQLNLPLITARTIADSMEGIKDPKNPLGMSRAQVNAMLKKLAEENPSFLATYTLWEPNAFDNFDALYAGKEGYDATGRLIPYWVRRADGSITEEPLIDYETPGTGDWYLIPRRTLQEYTVAPLIYPVGGVDTMMASFIVPVIVDGKFYGIAGVDAPITFVQSIVDNVNLYNGNADAVLFTDTGTLIAVHKTPDLSNQPAEILFPDFADLQPRIAAGESFVSLSPDGQSLRVFSPVDIGDVGTHWSFSLIIPFAVITAPATQTAIVETLIGGILLVLALYLLWYLTGQIVRPIRELTDIAGAITQGNLNTNIEVNSANETGTLATVFKTMTLRLRETIEGLEERVAERTQNLELAAKVGRTVSQVQTLDTMLTDAAEQIREQFGLYYVQVYLLNPSRTYLTLQAGTGTVGQQLLARNHRLPFNTNSLNGRAAVEERSVVISNTLKSITFQPNALLPETRSEISVPLMVGSTVVGVLDLQSNREEGLNKESLPAFEALAGQLAIAIQNANLLAETQQARSVVEEQARRTVRTNWDQYMDAIHKPEQTGFVFEQDKVAPLSSVMDHESIGENTLTSSIALIGEKVGDLVVEMGSQTGSTQSAELVDAVARQVAERIESLRLLESAERFRAEAEEASRRLTREGWQEYLAAKEEKSLAYLYDLKEVRAVDDAAGLLEAEFSLPIKVGDEVIGKLAVKDIPQIDAASHDLANAVVNRLSQHIENLRLLEKTEESRAEIQQSQERLSEALNIARLGNWEYDVEKDLFTFNDNFYSIFHTDVKEIGSYYMSSSEYARRFVHPEDAALVGGEIGKALNSPEKNYSTQLEHRVLYADGGIGYISVKVHVERDENGKIARFYGANQDVTERKQAEEELRARENQLSVVLAETQSLYRINEAITNETDIETIYQTVANLVCREMEFDGSWIAVYEPEKEAVRGVAGVNIPEDRLFLTLPIDQKFPALQAARTRQTVIVNNPEQDENMKDVPVDLQPVLGKTISAPIMSGPDLLGVIGLTRIENTSEIGAREERMVQAVTNQLSIVMQRVKLFDQLRKQAERESMLNIINQKIQSATSVEAVLQIAARELGHALGAPMAIAQLNMKETAS